MAQPASPPAAGPPDPFYWGSRLQRVEVEGRDSRLVEIPLRREDLLDPREGDMMVHGPLHGLFIRTLADMLDRWLDAEDVAVFDDVKMLWGLPGVPDVAPDISVIRGIRDKWRDRASFSVIEEGVRPCLVIEVISPRYRDLDEKDKLAIYRQARIPEYLIVDITTTPPTLTGYRLTEEGRYRQSRPDRFLSPATGLRFSAGSAALEIVVEDAESGERLLTSSEEAAARKALEAQLRRLQEKFDRLQADRSGEP